MRLAAPALAFGLRVFEQCSGQTDGQTLGHTGKRRGGRTAWDALRGARRDRSPETAVGGWQAGGGGAPASCSCTIRALIGGVAKQRSTAKGREKQLFRHAIAQRRGTNKADVAAGRIYSAFPAGGREKRFCYKLELFLP